VGEGWLPTRLRSVAPPRLRPAGAHLGGVLAGRRRVVGGAPAFADAGLLSAAQGFLPPLESWCASPVEPPARLLGMGTLGSCERPAGSARSPSAVRF